jgi:Uma2 family endonuclease
MLLPYARHRISVDEYHLMYDAFSPDDRIELIDGELFETVVPMKPPHAAGIATLSETLPRYLGSLVAVRCQVPVILDKYSEPQPDFTIARRDPRYYIDGHPRIPDIFSLIEVADSSRDADRRMKIPLYGRCGVPESWLIDLVDDLVFVYRDPGPEGYRLVVPARRGEAITPLAFPDRSIPVDEILPRR